MAKRFLQLVPCFLPVVEVEERGQVEGDRDPIFWSVPAKNQDQIQGSGIRTKDCDPCIFSLFHWKGVLANPPESSGMKARHASESKKAEEGDDPSDSKAEQGDVVGVPVRQEVDV